MSRFISPITDLKPNGSLYFYESKTNVEKVTYKDELETIPNPTKVVVLPNGNLPNVFYSGVAKVLFLDEFDEQYAERDPVGADSDGGGFSLWSSVETYPLNEYVQGSDGNLYKSLSAGNIGNDPITSSTDWEEVNFIGVWNTNITYAIGNVVQTSTGNLWKALTATAGNDPSSDGGTNWLPAITNAIQADIDANTTDIDALEDNLLWSIESADFTAEANKPRQIDASANTVDIALPVLVVGQSFVYHNLITSTFKVQILNPTETIKGKTKDFAAGINVELAPGNSIQMVAKSATILSIVGVLL